MKGNNTLQLNQSTMKECVEYWLKQVVMKDEKFEVSSVKIGKNQISGFDPQLFEIELKGLEDET